MRNGTRTIHNHALRSMAVLLKGLGVRAVLELTTDVSTFALDMRERGFAGLIFSAATQPASRRRMKQDSRGDLRRIMLPNPMADGEAGEKTLMLPPAVADVIDAIRIESVSDEVQVLAAAVGQLQGLALLMVEPGLARNGSGPQEEGRNFMTELGFEPLSFASGETTDEIAYPGVIYVRHDLAAEARILLAEAERDVPPAKPSDTRATLDAVVVSLPARPPKRPYSFTQDVGAEWLASCHASWTRVSANVISISEADPIFSNISWRKVERKPSLKQIIASLAEEPPPGHGPILLTNADIILGPQLEQLLTDMDPHVFYYCSRLDVAAAENNPRNLELQGEYVWGFDAFFLPRETIAAIHAQMLLPAGLLIGEPYWDYALPIAALVAGHPIKKFFVKPHPIVHLMHDAISNLHLDKTERIFLRWVRELRLRSPSPVSKLITEFVDAYDYTPGSKRTKSETMCRAIVTGLP